MHHTTHHIPQFDKLSESEEAEECASMGGPRPQSKLPESDLERPRLWQQQWAQLRLALVALQLPGWHEWHQTAPWLHWLAPVLHSENKAPETWRSHEGGWPKGVHRQVQQSGRPTTLQTAQYLVANTGQLPAPWEAQCQKICCQFGPAQFGPSLGRQLEKFLAWSWEPTGQPGWQPCVSPYPYLSCVPDCQHVLSIQRFLSDSTFQLRRTNQLERRYNCIGNPLEFSPRVGTSHGFGKFRFTNTINEDLDSFFHGFFGNTMLSQQSLKTLFPQLGAIGPNPWTKYRTCNEACKLSLHLLGNWDQGLKGMRQRKAIHKVIDKQDREGSTMWDNVKWHWPIYNDINRRTTGLTCQLVQSGQLFNGGRRQTTCIASDLISIKSPNHSTSMAIVDKSRN